jgi:parallel beta-helix repeat protein
MLKILVLALVAVVWGPRAGEASFLDDFESPTSVNYTGSNSYGSGGSFTVSGGKLNITVGNDNTFSVMTSDAVGFTTGETLSLEVPASSGNHDVFMMCSTTAGQPDGSSTFGFRFRRDGAEYARMNLYPGGIIANTLDPSPDKPATLLVKRISDIDFEYSIKIEGAQTQLGSFTLPSLAGIYNLHIGAQAYKQTSDVFTFDNLSIRSSRIHNITKDIWYGSIQLSIDGASNGDQIEVAPGTYTEAINFNGKAVRLYSSGGPGVTIINGTGNYHVVQCVSGEDANTIIEGFTITGGNANGSDANNWCGAGMFNFTSSPTITNCTFSNNTAGNFGGGIYNENTSSPTVTNCTFSNNAAYYGGGMYNSYTNPTVTNCRFVSNTAGLLGGGMHNEHSYPTVTNCSFIGNTAYAHGGGIMNNYGKGDFGGVFFIVNCSFIKNSAVEWGGGCCNANTAPCFVNCTFSGNTASDGGGTYNAVNTTMTATNCIYWGDMPNEIVNNSSTTIVNYSDVEGGWVGTGNIDADPIFTDVNGRLSPGSPCIDAGDNSTVTKAIDLDGNPRIIDGDGNGKATVDMGAYEIPNANAGITGIKGTVVEVDSAGKVSGPLAGAVVTLSGQETAMTVTDSNGNFSFLNISAGDYTVTIAKSDYYGVDSKIYIGENEILHEVFQLAYKSASQSPVGYDFVSPDGRHFIAGIPGNIKFEITVAWNGSAGDVNFCIGNDCYPATVIDLGGGLAKASLTIPATSIANAFSKLAIDVVNGEGQHTYINTDVRFHPVPEIVSFWYKDVIPWIPSGSSLLYSEEGSWEWNLPFKAKDVSLTALAYLNRGLKYDLKSGTFSGSFGGAGAIGVKWPVEGIKILGEGKLGLVGTLDICLGDEQFDIDITPGWQVSFTGKAGVEVPLVVLVEVIFPPAKPSVDTMLEIPALGDLIQALKVRQYYILGIGAKGEYNDLESGDCFLGSTKVDVSGTFGIEIQLMVDAGNVQIGVYAGGTGSPNFEICPDFKFNSVIINAYVGVYAKTWWFKVSKRYGCTIQIGGSSETKALSAQMLGTASEPDVTWELASDSLKRWGPANRPVGSAIREQAFTSKAGGAGSEAQTIAENVIDTASPSVVSDASQTMLLFSLHDVSKPDPCASDIGTFISTGGGAWSAGRIADDSASDFVAKVMSVGSDSYLAAWERISGDVYGLR